MMSNLTIPHFPFNVIDLTHPISPDSPSWDASCGFQHKITLDYEQCTTTTPFRVQTIQMHAGIGTHMDAPAHCIPGGKTIEQLSLSELIAPCVVIDVSKEADASYVCESADIQSFERKYGTISRGSFVIIYTGWSRYWHQPKQYRNDLQFPSISKETALLLLEREVVGLGIDTFSADKADSDYPVHRALLGAGKYLVENIAYAEQLPAVGSYSMALPILTVGGTEAPIRLIGLIPL